MTPREIVTRAVEGTGPPRVPIYYCNRDFEHSDVLVTCYAQGAGFVPSQPGMTEWGYVWHSLDQTMGQPHVWPLARWESIEGYVPPDPLAPGRLDHVPGWTEEHAGKFLVFGVGITGFNCATFLRGFEPFLMDLSLHPERVEKVLDIVFGFENGIIDQLGPFDLDAVKLADDWGTQEGLIVRPEIWRQVFKPRYADQFARVRQAGMKVWLHTCGDVSDIIPDLIEIGVDILELLQPDVFGVERLARDFGGKVCFCCSIDHQRLAVSGTRDEIVAYARLLNEQLGAFNGGFIAYIEDYASLGMTEQSYQWIREAFHGPDASRPLPQPGT